MSTKAFISGEPFLSPLLAYTLKCGIWNVTEFDIHKLGLEQFSTPDRIDGGGRIRKRKTIVWRVVCGGRCVSLCVLQLKILFLS